MFCFCISNFVSSRFNIFINDIPLPKDAHLAIFADHFDLLQVEKRKTSSKYSLRSSRENFCLFKSWKIQLNPTKTEFIAFTQSGVMKRKLAQFRPLIPRTFYFRIFASRLGLRITDFYFGIGIGITYYRLFIWDWDYGLQMCRDCPALPK